MGSHCIDQFARSGLANRHPNDLSLLLHCLHSCLGVKNTHRRTIRQHHHLGGGLRAAVLQLGLAHTHSDGGEGSASLQRQRAGLHGELAGQIREVGHHLDLALSFGVDFRRRILRARFVIGKVPGPLKTTTDTWALPEPSLICWMIAEANLFDIIHPKKSMLLLASTITMRSTSELHVSKVRVPSRPFMSLIFSAQVASLQGLNCTRCSEKGSAHLPVPFSGTMTVFIRLLVPPPQAREQSAHSVHSESAQSTSQASSPQDSASSVSPQGSPSCSGSTCTARLRARTPPPQAAVQADHWLHSSATQSTGHGKSLHDSVFSSGGQDKPLPTVWVMTLRVLLKAPPPQDTEHSSSFHSDTSQSVMNTFTPSMLFSSPRILPRAQSSDIIAFLLSQHSCMLRTNSSEAACWAWLCVCDPVSASFCSPVDTARDSRSSRSLFCMLLI